MGSLPLSAGTMVFEGTSLRGLRPYEINRLGVSLVPEGRRLFPNLTVTENLQLAARSGGMSIEDIFQLFPRLRTRQAAKAENLSGGERQMVAIARSLVVPSKLILLDEPFEGLAPAVVNEVMESLVKLRGKVAMVLVEHHAEMVLPIADRAYVLVNGRVAFAGDAVHWSRITISRRACSASSRPRTRLRTPQPNSTREDHHDHDHRRDPPERNHWRSHRSGEVTRRDDSAFTSAGMTVSSCRSDLCGRSRRLSARGRSSAQP